jgi:hypothetical protein
MKNALSLLSVVALLFVFTAARADEEKKVTLKGTICCAKCELKKEAKCATVIKVKDKIYYFDEVSGKKHHKAICTEPKEGEVTGTVSKDGDKLIIKVTDLKFND